MTGLTDCVIEFSIYFYFILKIYFKTVVNTQSNVTCLVNNICDVSQFKSGDNLSSITNLVLGISAVCRLYFNKRFRIF